MEQGPRNYDFNIHVIKDRPLYMYIFSKKSPIHGVGSFSLPQNSYLNVRLLI
jgi:hypothetical protein